MLQSWHLVVKVKFQRYALAEQAQLAATNYDSRTLYAISRKLSFKKPPASNTITGVNGIAHSSVEG